MEQLACVPDHNSKRKESGTQATQSATEIWSIVIDEASPESISVFASFVSFVTRKVVSSFHFLFPTQILTYSKTDYRIWRQSFLCGHKINEKNKVKYKIIVRVR